MATEGEKPPYPVILDGLRRGDVIPFLGAGASLHAERGAWSKEDPGGPPTATDLTAYLADRSSFPEPDRLDLTTVAQYYNIVNGRRRLHDELREIFARDYPVRPIHRFLASLESPLLIVTTNYDGLLERALDEAGREYDLVVHTTDPALGELLLWWPHGTDEPAEVRANQLDVDLAGRTVVYKMHGAVDRLQSDRDQYVITEDDYIDFLARMTQAKAIPTIFAEPFQRRSFLFLGYALRDWNLRACLNRIGSDLRRPDDIASWAIDAAPSPLEQRFWSQRRVEVYRATVDEFVREIGPL